MLWSEHQNRMRGDGTTPVNPVPSSTRRLDHSVQASQRRDSGSSSVLRDQCRTSLVASLAVLDEAIARIQPEHDEKEFLVASLCLRSELETGCYRLADEKDGPSSGEPLGHWLEGLIRSCATLTNSISQARQKKRRSSGPNLSHRSRSTFSGDLRKISRLISAAERLIQHDRVAIEVIRTQPAADLDAKSPIQSVATTSEDVAAHPYVLVVDADRQSRGDMEDMLIRLNYRVVAVQSVASALDLLEQQRFEVCLLDLRSTSLSVTDTIKQIRDLSSSGEPHVIVVVEPNADSAAAEAIEGGADDCVESPVNERLLNARIRSSLEKTDARMLELSKFLPRDVLNQVIRNKNLMEKPRPADVSVMVCDVRGFSRVSERLGPVQTITWISDVMNELSHIILDHGGTIVDYVGDEVMAMWGAPIGSPHHASEACDCAIAIQRAVERLSEKWKSKVGSETRMGIGINSGLAVVGNTGSKLRVKYGPLGDTVNLASRVQGATKYLRSSILISQSTASRIDTRLQGRRVCSVRVHNIHEPVQLFELETCTFPPSDPNCQVRRSIIEAYEQALAAFEDERLGDAQTILARLLIDNPKDGPSLLLLLRVIQSQLGGSFDPVWTLSDT